MARLIELLLMRMVEYLDNYHNDPEGIHQTRVTCKRLRSIAKLLRKSLPKRAKQLNAEIRDIARLLSLQRDIEVKLDPRMWPPILAAMYRAERDKLPEDLRLLDQQEEVWIEKEEESIPSAAEPPETIAEKSIEDRRGVLAQNAGLLLNGYGETADALL